ncbi:hypothetical protein CDCA_CDCA08G2416 [Cyanidium caldarium]|uniref:Elongation of fatty acids protein n=1 Tax=Cyanidium caldarium TaxID=2771 RepID=A0AAV9IW53_CYACA|nr:hypothetical protein CDCA_CDCA08G2416 [Cyanidium caldarium]
MVTHSVRVAAQQALQQGSLDGLRSFRFRYGATALSTWYIPVGTCLLYYAMQRIVQAIMRKRQAPRLNYIMFVYNLLMSAGSAVLFTAMSAVLLERWLVFSVRDLVCSAAMHDDGRLQFMYWINYLFKYVELLDTLFLAVRKRRIIFLHSYHHAATLLLCWSQQVEHSTVQWVVIYINLGVHVLMYYYYGVAVMGIKPWWRKHLTKLQIAQFVIDLVACSYAYGVHTVYGFGACHGTPTGAYTGIAILASYLLLFVKFYIDTYKRPPKHLKE